MNHVVINPRPGELGFGCKCGEGFPTRKLADLHASDQNLIEKNEAKAKQAEAHATESAHQAPETTEPAEGQEAAPEPEIDESKPEQSANSEKAEPAPAQNPQPPATQPTPAAAAPQALSPSNLPLDLENLSLNQINFIGQTMAKSGMFPDVTDGAKARVKILAGKEIGVTPFQSMTNIHVIQGKAMMGANLMAAKVKGFR